MRSALLVSMTTVNNYVIGGTVGIALTVAALFASARWLTAHPTLRRLLRVLAVVALIFGATSIWFGSWLASGDRSPIAATELANGIVYERLILDDAVAHVMSFDLSDPCLSLTTTAVRPDGSVDAQKTTSWARAQEAVAAINSNYFFPYVGGVPWRDPTPSEGDPVNILGTVKRAGEQPISASSEYGRVRHRLWVDESNVPHIGLQLGDDAVVAVTGRELVLDSSTVVGHESENYPRTIVGISAGTTQMWWLVVDGKRPGYSEGVTFDEAAEFLRSRGATDAVALDGGGSSTMVVNDGSGVRMLNLTLNQGVPNRERAIANHLGVIRPSECLE